MCCLAEEKHPNIFHSSLLDCKSVNPQPTDYTRPQNTPIHNLKLFLDNDTTMHSRQLDHTIIPSQDVTGTDMVLQVYLHKLMSQQHIQCQGLQWNREQQNWAACFCN